MDIFCGKAAFSVERAHEAQLCLSKRIILEDRVPEKIHAIAGVDVAYLGDKSIGAVTVSNPRSLEIIESQIAVCKTRLPYIPTLLSFRETWPIMKCIDKLEAEPDLFLVDGQGYAHPYRYGLASHLGLILGKPTVGVAKNRLFGEIENANARTDVAYLKHKDETVGAVLTTRKGSRPVYVSVGHMVSLDRAIRIVRECTRGNRLPEPLLEAHATATSERRKIHILSPDNK